MAGRLIALDKNSVVRPTAIGEVLQRLIAKYVLGVAKGEAQEACGIHQFCGGLQTGIEVGGHAMHSGRHTRWKRNGDSFSLMPAMP